MDFFKQLKLMQVEKNSLLCVGIDPDIDKIPNEFKDVDALLNWCEVIVDKTIAYTPVYKPNIAFFSSDIHYEIVLERLIEYIHNKGALVILDGKRGDIGNTAKKYGIELFDRYGADSVTLNPYLGLDTIEPYLEYEEKGLILLCRTSNAGASMFQNLTLKSGEKLYENIAKQVKNWAIENCCIDRLALVVGATAPSELSNVRKIIGNNMFILIPAIGKQGGDIKLTVESGQNDSAGGMVISSSSAIIFSDTPEDVARKTRDEINKYRNFKK